jgi:hypothetical protein
MSLVVRGRHVAIAVEPVGIVVDVTIPTVTMWVAVPLGIVLGRTVVLTADGMLNPSSDFRFEYIAVANVLAGSRINPVVAVPRVGRSSVGHGVDSVSLVIVGVVVDTSS